MFGSSRKNRAPAQPLTKETANPNAATAAASAFMRREPSTSLSSAAAAAALKARPTTPTNVAEVQSRRTVRRSPSVSSTASRGRDRIRDPRELRRSPSTGSMTERTFRSPSPGRGPAPRQYDVPPVPSLPSQAQTRSQRPTSSHRSGVTTLQTQPFRTASQKQKDGDGGSWFGAAAAREGASARKSDAILYSSPQGPHARSGSISPSINFSYPRARETDLASDYGVSDQTLVYDANSRRMVPKIDLVRRSQSVREASEKPVKQKRKSDISRSGSHLSKGTVGRTKQAAVEPVQPVRHSTPPVLQPVSDSAITAPPLAPVEDSEPDSEPETARVSSEAKPTQPTATVDSNSNQLVQESEESDDEYAASELEPQTTQPLDQSSRVEAKPSVRSANNTKTETSSQQHHSIDSVPVRSTGTAPNASTNMDIEAPVSTEPKSLTDGKSDLASAEPSRQYGSVRRARMHSESPARSPGRSAHFAPAADQLLVRHEPPPRSLSPRKSALKQSSSVRGASPSDDSSEASEQPTALGSKDEQARKKSVRVSFNDDSNVVVGEAAEPAPVDSPVPLSPQMKKPWHNILGRNRKDTSAVEEEETMTPRPALPLFGSVRDKKTREPDSERPLVRPSERSWSPPPESSSTEQSGTPAGSSTDAGIGSVVAQDSASRNEANISRMREPLPPVVTSIEGTGYDSSLLMTSDDEDMDDTHDAETAGTAETTAEPSQEDPSTADRTEETLHKHADASEHPAPGISIKQPNGSAVAEEVNTESASQQRSDIPSISIASPSPLAKESSPTSPEFEYFDVPGGFPDEDRQPMARGQSSMAAEQATSHVAVAGSNVNPPVEVAAVEAETTAPVTPDRTEPAIAIPPMADIQEEEESTDGSSIYSDAYEDMSDAEAEGFISLDAVLTAPADSKVSKLFEKTKRRSQEANPTLGPVVPSESEASRDPTETHDDWENAKAYWRGLTLEKRRQLEMEALEEAGEDADQEEVTKQKKKTKKRRSTDRPAPAINTSEISQDPDRTYQIQPGTSWAHEEEKTPTTRPKDSKSSNVPAAAPKFRKSMRGGQPAQASSHQAPQATGTLRKSMRAGGNSEAARNTTSLGTSTVQPTAAKEVARNMQRAQSSDGRPFSTNGLASAGMKPTLRRRGSDSSESSFKRSRPQSQGFGFRSSMRAGTQESESPASATKGSGRFSLRSLSPTGSAFRRSSFTTSSSPGQSAAPGGSRMRQSLRSGPAARKESKKRTSALGRLSGKKEKKGKGGSRFADSSDEEDRGPAFFSSRFADSSDEEDVAPPPASSGGFNKSMRTSKGANLAAAAALGVPPSQQRSDSPDLPDSDDDIVQPKRNIVMNGTNGRAGGNLQRSRSGRGSLVTPVTPGQLDVEGVGERPTHKRRGSFMSSILRRKKNDTDRISRDVSESAARRDTRLERSTEHLQIIRSNSGNQSKLHKRDISWPLPEQNDEAPQPSTNGEPQRPATSAGPATTQSRQGFLKRRNTSNQEAPAASGSLPMTESPAEVSKGKKFGKLRKMFGLND